MKRLTSAEHEQIINYAIDVSTKIAKQHPDWSDKRVDAATERRVWQWKKKMGFAGRR